MKVKTQHEVILLSIMFLALALGGVYTFKSLAPGAYNQITGYATSTTVNITQGENVPCNFTMHEGLNLVSFHCIGDLTDRDIVTGELDNLDAAWDYDKGSSDPWKAYKPGLPDNIVTDLEHFSKREGYWIRVNATEQFLLTGPLISGTEIDVSPGYNLVGYPTNESENITTSLQTISGNYSKVVGFDPSSKNFKTYVPGSGGDLEETKPGRGYWINATGSDTWVVD